MSRFLRRLLEEGGWGKVWTGLGMAIALAGGGLIYQQVGGGGGGACEWPDCFPDASNTGVPPGTTLTAYSGPTTITADDTVIDSKTITDCLVIDATGVIIRKSMFNPSGSCNFVVFGETGTVSFTIEDSEFDCDATSANAVSGKNMTLERLDIYECENGVDARENVILRDSYIHDLDQGGADPHLDAVQWAWGEDNLYEHNTMLVRDTSAIIMDNYDGHPSVNDWTVTNNLMGAQTAASVSNVIYCVGAGTPVSNGNITNNSFKTEFPPVEGYSTGCDRTGVSWSGNIEYETGDPVVVDQPG